ncbi:MAG TPA: SDR family NAD(P)-dependent oxidoreductase [Casimicrobiaceae bacterium]|nr:SDR family NAD(P)-dependent oxidoreductase [Casimicrobiaceae bacterium]
MQQPLGRIVVVNPFEQPNAAMAVAASRAGGLGVVDVGHDPVKARAALERIAGEPERSLGVRIPAGVDLPLAALPRSVGAVIVEAGMPFESFIDLIVAVEVTSLAEARAAEASGARALIAKGSESGGRIGDETTFVLLQSLVPACALPVYAQGGIGLRTAAACIAGGAAGVVLDAQAALARESSLSADVQAAIGLMDGSETVVVGGRRQYSRPGWDRGTVLPAGQDAAFARPLAARFRTTGGIVRGIEAAIDHNLDVARCQRSLGERGPLAARHGLRYPIFQGPMTRVSDRAAFADAVADAGALPFLALALMRGPEVEALLAETSQRLAGKTWGVGILGFVPQELREEQLEVVRRVKPPVALIAGGRPAQAKPLEELGIRTFLHTPSPGLLELFLKQGARRFVFEGSECGGHVGPRTSFALWEAQIECLLAHPAPSELEVVFAGGIHDARSAAMVAAMAAPLAERGAAVGVLMGTAYLFTSEAVSCGAIQPAFQQAALDCEATVLLETAPGHSTRCADTDYVRAFRAQREKLTREGLPVQAMWQKLEELNLGRLRIAAKGLARDGERLVSVDEKTQRRDGMVMLGQVAALRDAIVRIDDLHRDVCEGSTALLASLPAQGAARARSGDVAIVGVAAIMPDAPDVEAFWSNIVRGINSIREVPPERWRVEAFYDPQSMNGEKTPSKWGGFLDPYPFDPLSYGIPPLSLAAIEPVQLLALEASRRALADAGYLDRPFDRENTSVVFGAEAGTDLSAAYGFRAAYRQFIGELPAELAAALPSMTEDSFPGMLGNVIAGRIANRLDLGGSNYTVDAACASSLAAVDVACKELVAGTSNMVICGGADLHNGIVDYLVFASVHALSPTGQCRTFDAGADGIALGEGIAAVVLKRLADAERDGDRIYAVIKGVGGASDGKSLGLTAPRAQGQARTLARAYDRAGIAPRDVGLIEAHGTGTVVGDRTELETLSQFFAGAGAAPGSIALGSIKSQIGHTKCAAGLAGLIKGALSLHRRVLPPTLNITKPNPAWTPRSPFTLSGGARPWPGRRRIAGVSAFGFGGTNFHVVLEGYDGEEAQSGVARWPAELFLFRGADRASALARAEKLAESLSDHGRPLSELARAAGEGDGAVQIALVARSRDDLAKKLAMAREGKAHSSGVFLASGEPAGRLAFLFPGQGSQRVGMLGDVFIAFPELQRLLERGARWRDTIFPPTAWGPDEEAAQQAALTDTRVAQPALGIAGLAMAQLLARFGVRPDMLAGHSYGELVALCVAGALPESALLELSELRGRRILESCADADDAGTMAAVSADTATTLSKLAGIEGVVVANENSPEQSVISGPRRAVEQAVERLLEASIAAKTIPVACAFHSPLVQGACDAFAADLARIDIVAPAQEVYSNTTAERYPTSPEAIRARLADHIGKPVRFAAEIEAMYAAGARIFVEAGPGRVLTGLVGRILGKRPHVAIACDRPGDDGITQFLLALGQLAVNGVAIDADALYAGRDVARLALDAPPAHPPNAWWVNGQRAWPMQGDPPPHALRPITQPIAMAAPHAASAPSGDREAVVMEYLRNMREIADTQRRVMMSFLGTVEPARAPIEAEVAKPAVAELPAPAAPPPAVAAQGEHEKPADIAAVLLDIVSQRTGYPLEMLDLDLDLEADLSIDSIKRVEILGAVAERMGARTDGGAGELPENVVALKTLRAIIDALRPLAAGGAPPPQHAPATAETPKPSAPVSRYVVQMQPLLRANGAWALGNREVEIIGAAPPLESALLGNLAAAGSRGKVGEGDASSVRHALVDLTPLRADWAPGDVPALFGRVREALVSGASHVLVAAQPRVNGSLVPPAGGVPGLIKSLRKEWPDRHVRVATFGQESETANLAELILNELNCADGAGEVDYSSGGVRHAPAVVKADRADSAAALSLDERSVVLLTGGARGITSKIALELGRRFKCRLELVGRTPAPEQSEDAELMDAADERTLRQLLIARHPGRRPAEIEAECARLFAAREIRGTLAALRAAGATASYHPCDVRDRAAFGALIEAIYERHGRLDGVIHGAGVIEDKLARDKTAESFARVFETKVHGALAIAEHVRDDVKFVVFFSSIVATFGNRGQSDYAAANDFLDRLAHALKHRLAGRVLSINWGPWRDAGMVSPELAREYARRGIDLIDPEAGVASFIDELLHGPASDAQVILMRGDPTAML